jgi:pimeloyl-ACP methyl ester carboxylesterase
MDALKIQKATLAGFDWGARTADITAALWPERCKALVAVSGYLIGGQDAGKIPSPPIVVHNYRWRLGLTPGEAQYDDLETKLAAGPVISVPTITLEGDANGAKHPEPAAYAKKFVGKYSHRLIKGGIGHNLPQEAPRDFAQAVIDAGAD